MGSISKGVADSGGSKKEQRLAKREAKAKSQGYDSLDQKKAIRKDKMKQALADAFGGGNRGFLTQQDPGLALMKEEQEDKIAKDTKNLTKKVGGDDAETGGGYDVSPVMRDRTSVNDNMSTAFYKKKGWM